MSIKFNVCLNNGNEAFGTGKSITANEVCETADRSKPSSPANPNPKRMKIYLTITTTKKHRINQ